MHPTLKTSLVYGLLSKLEIRYTEHPAKYLSAIGIQQMVTIINYRCEKPSAASHVHVTIFN